MATKYNKPSSFIALSTAAMALPGINSDADAAIPQEDYALDFRYTSYQEDSFEASDSIDIRDRYDISVMQLGFSGPLKDTMDFSIDFSTDSMTGATGSLYFSKSLNVENSRSRFNSVCMLSP